MTSAQPYVGRTFLLLFESVASEYQRLQTSVVSWHRRQHHPYWLSFGSQQHFHGREPRFRQPGTASADAIAPRRHPHLQRGAQSGRALTHSAINIRLDEISEVTCTVLFSGTISGVRPAYDFQQLRVRQVYESGYYSTDFAPGLCKTFLFAQPNKCSPAKAFS